MQNSITPTQDLIESAYLGAKFLDQHFPRWFQKVDLETLDLSSEEYCVLAQVLDVDYSEANTILYNALHGDFDYLALGFYCDLNTEKGWQTLNEAWKIQVMNRQTELSLV